MVEILIGIMENFIKVSFVNYPFLEDSNEYYKATKYLENGTSGILNFGIKGGIEDINDIIIDFENAFLKYSL